MQVTPNCGGWRGTWAAPAASAGHPLVEQLLKEALAPLAPVVRVVPVPAALVPVPPMSRGRRRRWWWRARRDRWRRCVRWRWWGCWRRCVRRRRGGRRLTWTACLPGRRGLVESRLSVDQPLQLAPVEKQAAALGALVDGDAIAFVLSHPALALRARHLHACDRISARRTLPCPRRRMKIGNTAPLRQQGDHLIVSDLVKVPVVAADSPEVLGHYRADHLISGLS